MNKVFIIGADAHGGPCTFILARDESISEIRLADIDLGLAMAVQKKIAPPPSVYGGLSGGSITLKNNESSSL